MPCATWVTALIFSGWLTNQPAWGGAFSDLDSLFQDFVRFDQTAPIQEHQIRQAEETYRQALGGIFPTINAIYSRQIQEKPNSSLGTSFFPSTQTTARITVNQPLFQGLREYAGLKQAAKLEDSQRSNGHWLLMQTYLELASFYFQGLAFQSDVEAIQTEIQNTEKRWLELKTNRKIGKSRSSEVLGMEANLEALRSQQSTLLLSRIQISEAIEILTGRKLNFESIPKKVSDFELDRKPEPLNQILGRIHQRPDLQSFRLLSDAAEHSIWVAKGAHLPTVGLSGNYWFQRPGVLQDVSWDVSMTVTLNLFNGGVLQSQARANQSAFQIANLQWKQAEKRSESEIRNLYFNVTEGIEMVKHLRKADELSEKALKEVTDEFKLGLTTVFEVLQTMTSASQAKRNYNRARYQLQENLLRLDVLTLKKALPKLDP